MALTLVALILVGVFFYTLSRVYVAPETLETAEPGTPSSAVSSSTETSAQQHATTSTTTAGTAPSGPTDVGMEDTTLPEASNTPVFCTQDAKQCPNGSYVGRVPPNCAFAPCPGTQ
jgi:hypothetical protein